MDQIEQDETNAHVRHGARVVRDMCRRRKATMTAHTPTPVCSDHDSDPSDNDNDTPGTTEAARGEATARALRDLILWQRCILRVTKQSRGGRRRKGVSSDTSIEQRIKKWEAEKWRELWLDVLDTATHARARDARRGTTTSSDDRGRRGRKKILQRDLSGAMH